MSNASKTSPHGEADAESSIDRPGHAEAAGDVEAFRMGIADHVQSSRPLSSSELGAVLNQGSSNSTTLHLGIHKQGVEFTSAVGSRFDRRKSDYRAFPLRNEHSTSSDLFGRQLNCVRMRE